MEIASYLFLADEALEDAVGFATHLAETKELAVVTHGKNGATTVVAGHPPFSCRRTRSRLSIRMAPVTHSAPG